MDDNSAREKLVGVGGWLALLVFLLMIICPILLLLRAMANVREAAILNQVLFGANTQSYISSSWILGFIAASVSIFLAYRLIAARQWSSIRIAVIGLWFLALMPILVDFAMKAAFFTDVADYRASLVPNALRAAGISCGFSVVWTAYLVMSKRVAYTYDKPA
ncbi:hypothetical protein ASE06_09865 [Sphingopyxis sp. Root214]|uniref:DUF2569 family protein n=1 Tax=unclassified Sphingopyxis TaxID=2614943 RepID=UPI00070120CF|nr:MULTISPECIES: DUF2569 family protein [unclassified Sphingopyxis]KQZ72775.1 hypothetical protein ASD73_07510 [Sphingopyxis sp. Root154]KRC06922.1 hypothetical protein ASE06_09865 [Sphingopyxis sp. Root214]